MVLKFPESHFISKIGCFEIGNPKRTRLPQNHVLDLKTCQKGGKNDTFPGRVGDFEDGTDKVMTWTGTEETAGLLGLFAGVACVP